MSTHEFFLDGIRQVYHVAGSGPIMIAHSGGPGLDYGYLRSPELEQRFTMVYLEPIGTGASGRLAQRDDYRLDRYVSFLAALVDHLGLSKVAILGHSYGGFVAQRYILDHPERVSGLILYDTSPMTGPEFWAAAMATLESYPQQHPDHPEAAEVPAAFQQALTATDDDAFTAALRAALPIYLADYWTRRFEFDVLKYELRGWADPAQAQDPAPFDVRDRLGEIAVPTLVIVGRHDFICGPPFAAMLHKGIAGSRLVVLEHSGHLGHLEQPTEFTNAVTETLTLRLPFGDPAPQGKAAAGPRRPA